MAARPNYASVAFKGNGMVEDSFARALCAAGTLLGRPADYATVSCRLTNPFAPGIDPGEDCLSHWCVEGKMCGVAAEAVAASVGLHLRRLAVPEMPCPDPDGKRPAVRIETARIIRQAMDAGQIVIAVDGWQATGPHGFTHWAWSGIVTEAREDGTLLGMHLNGHGDNPITDTDLFCAVSLAQTKPSELEADLAMLRTAADRIAGKGAFASTRRRVWGLNAMDAWIERMRQDEGFCTHCHKGSKRGWADADTNARRMHAMALVLADHLTRRRDVYPVAVRRYVDDLVRRYRGIADLLKPALAGDGGQKFEQFIGDMNKQRAYASDVLMRVRREIERVGKTIEAALAALHELPGQVRPDALVELANRDYIGLQAPYLGAGVPKAIVAALNHAGTRIDFNEFVAVTGWAFSFGYKHDDWRTACMAVCGKSGADGPYEVFRWLPEKLGYTFEGVPVRDQAKFAAFVKQHVDAGRPVMSEHFDGGVICGYRQNAGQFEVWFDATVAEGWTPAGKMQPTWVFVLNRTGEPMERKQLYLAALARAITKASPHEHNGAPQGLAALEAYRRDVADPSKTFEKTSEWFCWATFERLMARRCCSVWLASATQVLGEPARAPLLEASAHYARAFEAYRRYETLVHEGEGTGVPLHERLRTPSMISKFAPLLDEAIAAERAGIAAMKKACG
jgi:hypothetical protein